MFMAIVTEPTVEAQARRPLPLPGRARFSCAQQLELGPAAFHLKPPFGALPTPVIQVLPCYRQQAQLPRLTRQAGALHLLCPLQQMVFQQQWPLVTLEARRCR